MIWQRKFTLRFLLLLVAVAGCFFGWVGIRLREAQEQRTAVAEVEKTGGNFEFGPIAGDEDDHYRVSEIFYKSPSGLYLYNSQHTKKQLFQLDSLQHSLIWLGLGGSTVSDQEMASVARLRDLQYLNLRATKVGDAGIQHLKPLGQLKGLDLMGCLITDDSVPILSQLNELEELNLCGTEISAPGLSQIRNALPNCRIKYGSVRRIEGSGDKDDTNIPTKWVATMAPQYVYADGTSVD